MDQLLNNIKDGYTYGAEYAPRLWFALAIIFIVMMVWEYVIKGDSVEKKATESMLVARRKLEGMAGYGPATGGSMGGKSGVSAGWLTSGATGRVANVTQDQGYFAKVPNQYEIDSVSEGFKGDVDRPNFWSSNAPLN